MFQQYLKPILQFSRSQNKAPNIMLIYPLIWLAWHYQFFIHLVVNNGSFSDKLSAAVTSNEHQYIVVLFLTWLFYALRLAYLYFTNKADALIEEEEPIEVKIGNDQIFSENKDVVRLLELLDETKEKLNKAKEKEAQTNNEKLAAINNAIALQNELEEVKADLAIMTSLNETLQSKQNAVA